jgi:hypothetical protein
MPKRPPCPGNPEDYFWLESRERPHWRRKRGSVGKAQLNAGFRDSNDRTLQASPAARRVRNALAPFLRGITTGRLNNRICNAFRKSLQESDGLRLVYLKRVEMQRDHPLDRMLVCDYKIRTDEKKVRIEIPVEWSSVKPFNNLVTNFYFEAVLLYGDASIEKGLHTRSVESALYPIHTATKSVCVLELELPQREDWCVLLKISCLEGKELAAHTKHYRMKVVGASEI